MKPIKSRYSLNNISSTNYGQIQIISTTSTTINSGVVWLPYTISTTIDPEYDRQFKRKQRIEKLKKLNGGKDIV